MRSWPPILPWTRLRHLIHTWLPLNFALNVVNRSTGHLGLYPYVPRPRAVRDRLKYVYDAVTGRVTKCAGPTTDGE